MTDLPSFESDPLTLWLQKAAPAYERQLQDPAITGAPNIGHIQDICEILNFTLEEGASSFSRNEVFALLVAQRHLSEGISAEELGLPVSEEYQEAKETVTRSAGEMLLSQMGDYSPEVRRIVQDLAEGILPFRNEIPVLLAALLEVMRQPRTLAKAEA